MGRHPVLAAAAVLLTALIGCIAAGGDQASGRPTGSSATSTPAAHPFYVSIGDSYAAGMQPTSSTERHTTRNGFAYQLVDLATGKGYALSLVNFGCGGATAGSLLHRIGCDHDRLGPGATPYDRKTQAAAAEHFLRAHRGHIGLITVAIGLNDLVPCADAAAATRCIEEARTRIRANLGTLLEGLRSAAGPAARIVGITYPDVFLAGLLDHSADTRRFAKQSVGDFRSQINPQLRKTYEAAGATFLDITKATGGYGSLTDKTTVPPYGTIPTPVARICRLTYACQFQDVHPRTKGYRLIAERIIDTLPTR
jgi:lysophospholipase L1-like esterase